MLATALLVLKGAEPSDCLGDESAGIGFKLGSSRVSGSVVNKQSGRQRSKYWLRNVSSQNFFSYIDGEVNDDFLSVYEVVLDFATQDELKEAYVQKTWRLYNGVYLIITSMYEKPPSTYFDTAKAI